MAAPMRHDEKVPLDEGEKPNNRRPEPWEATGIPNPIMMLKHLQLWVGFYRRLGVIALLGRATVLLRP